jgi:hypothetical protein
MIAHELHHVIASDERGPHHALNLVGLCPNHHAALEIVRRKIRDKTIIHTPAWMTRAEAAIKTLDFLPDPERQLFDSLSEPHPLRHEMQNGLPDKYRVQLAMEVAKADARFLLHANRARPRVLLWWLFHKKIVSRPKDRQPPETLLEESTRLVTAVHLADVVKLHLNALGLPFDISWLCAD